MQNGLPLEGTPSTNRVLSAEENGMMSAKHVPNGKHGPNMMINEVNSEMSRIRSENNQLRARAEYIDRNLMDVMQENAIMHNRIENLENVFLIKDKDKEEDN